MSSPATFYCSPDYYFCIKEYARNEPYGDYRYLGVVKLGPLSTDEADMIFQEAVRPLIDVINQTPGYGYSDRVHLRSIAVTKNGFDEQYYELRSEYDVDDKRILLRWKMMSDSFLRDRYQDSLRQLDQMGPRNPTDDTILATAVRAAELILQKPLSVEYAVSPLPTENTCPPPPAPEGKSQEEKDQSPEDIPMAPDRQKTKNRHSYNDDFRKEMAQLGISIVRQYPWEDNVSALTRLAKKKDSRFERQYFGRWVNDFFGVSFEEKRREIRELFGREFGGDNSSAEIDNNLNRVRGRAPASPDDELLAKEWNILLKQAIKDFLEQENLHPETDTDELGRIRENDPAFAERLRLALLPVYESRREHD